MHKYYIRNPIDEQVFDFGLYLFDDQLCDSGKSLEDFEDTRRPKLTWSDAVGDKFTWEHRCLQLTIWDAEVEESMPIHRHTTPCLVRI